ncbi:MAG: hypothetical protein WAW85_05560 [Gordonia sp. (in: high G+C Gram-positive bacteria)]|uniref:hypothetical protein n=1 Tax=Gordonia sp. (in: high G+C Gram-positive bacteria) TaxID=84139 RepID=UPI003BB507F7
MAKKNDNEGCIWMVGGLVVLGVLLSIPKEVWIVVGVLVVAAVMVAMVVNGQANRQKRRVQEAEAAKVVAARAERERRKQFVDELGRRTVARIDWARSSADRVAASEAAREGWLGDTDFGPDLAAIVDSFRRARALREKAAALIVLDSSNIDDRRIIDEAEAAAQVLDDAANRNVDLIERCAAEAAAIDESLQADREAAATAQQRTELHGELSALLYGVEADPVASSNADSAAERVMARVRGYREIKQQIRG